MATNLAFESPDYQDEQPHASVNSMEELLAAFNRLSVNEQILYKPKVFHGIGSAAEFLMRFELSAYSNNWNDSAKLRHVCVCMKGRAIDWLVARVLTITELKDGKRIERLRALHEVLPGVTDTERWQAFKELMIGAFPGKLIATYKLHELSERRKDENESYPEYVNHVLRLCLNLNPLMEEEEKIVHILHGLPSDMRQEIILADVHTVREVEHLLFLHEEKKEYLKKVRIDKEEGEERINQAIEVTDEKIAVGVNKNLRCWRCNGQNHSFRNCRFPIYCFRCKRKGHFRKNCTFKSVKRLQK
jgi:hypothetical protein